MLHYVVAKILGVSTASLRYRNNQWYIGKKAENFAIKIER